MKNKDAIKLREREGRNGIKSLYLDTYRDGRRTYEFLKLYIIPETNRADKDKNRATYQLAEAIRAKRTIELQNGEFGFKQDTGTRNVRFFDYLDSYIESRKNKSRANTIETWHSVAYHLRTYERNSKTTFANITAQWIEGFKEYLATCTSRRGTLAVNSQRMYMDRLRACIRQAVSDDILDRNPFDNVENIRTEEVERSYLTQSEIARLAQCREGVNDCTARAFLFSCLTGLRWSDVSKLTWADVSTIEGGLCRITFRQTKTRQQEYLDITPQAVSLMGYRPTDNTLRVFNGLFKYLANVNRHLKRWTELAGIDKHITFHCARHTFAIMMLDLGTDIYTVSKLLGHRDISTTQIYAKVLDKNKQKAVLNIPRLI